MDCFELIVLVLIKRGWLIPCENNRWRVVQFAFVDFPSWNNLWQTSSKFSVDSRQLSAFWHLHQNSLDDFQLFSVRQQLVQVQRQLPLCINQMSILLFQLDHLLLHFFCFLLQSSNIIVSSLHAFQHIAHWLVRFKEQFFFGIQLLSHLPYFLLQCFFLLAVWRVDLLQVEDPPCQLHALLHPALGGHRDVCPVSVGEEDSFRLVHLAVCPFLLLCRLHDDVVHLLLQILINLQHEFSVDKKSISTDLVRREKKSL